VLQIRREQVAVFDRIALGKFEDELLAHLKTFAGRHCEIIGDEGTRQVIQLGLRNSAKYGFTLRGPIRLYVELMFMFGSYFDTDLQHPWAAEALRDPRFEPQMEMFRADTLHQKMMDYLAAVSGPGHQYTLKALRETRNMASEPFSPTAANLLPQLEKRMQAAYPEKCAWLGEEKVRAVLQQGIEVGRSKRVTTIRGMTLFGVLAFALGHRFAEDPLYPWIANTLEGASKATPSTRAERLEAKALLYLDRVLKHLGGA
jgi:hypothetical protein